MPESIHSRQNEVFPFPKTPRFTNLTEVCKYLNDCGFDITWQSFHRTYLSYINDMRSVIRQQMRAHGIETKIGEYSLHDKISMLIVRDMLHDRLRHILVQSIQKRGFANRDHFVDRLTRYAETIASPQGITRQKMMLNHLDEVMNAIIDSLDSYNGGETNKGYLNKLYRSSIENSIASFQLIRRPEKWFVILENQHDMNMDVLAPRFASSYVSMFQTFSSLLEDEEPDLHALSELIAHVKNHNEVVRKASIRRNASMLQARRIIAAKTEEDIAKESIDATKETLNLVRVIKNKKTFEKKISKIFAKGKNAVKAMEIRAEMKRTMEAYGCSASTEKKIYRGCSAIIEDIDNGLISPDEFEEHAYELVHTELIDIAKRSVVDPMAHAAVIDYRVADFISELFNVSRDTMEGCRYKFAQHIASYMDQDSEPQSSSLGDDDDMW